MLFDELRESKEILSSFRTFIVTIEKEAFPEKGINTSLEYGQFKEVFLDHYKAAQMCRVTHRRQSMERSSLFSDTLILKFEFIGSIPSTCAKLSIDRRARVNVYMKRLV